MTAQKRSFSSFIDDSHHSTSSLPSFSSFLDAVNQANDVQQFHYNVEQYSDDVQQYPESIQQCIDSLDGTYAGSSETQSIPYPSFEITEHDATSVPAIKTAFEPFQQSNWWLDEDGVAPDSSAHSSLSSELTPQDSRSSASSQVDERFKLIEPKDVCYGMIHLSKVKLIGSMQAVMQELENLSEGILKSHYLLDVVWHDKELFLVLPSSLRAAQLNQQISEALEGYVTRGEVRLQALLHRETVLNDIAKATTLKNAETTVNINVYGNHNMVQSIGNCLSKHKIWLQRPDWRPVESTYDNPHVIHFVNAHSSDTNTVIPLDDIQFSDSLSIQIEDVYSQLSRAGRLQGVAGDSRLINPLLPHQEAALDFMMQREGGNIPDEFKLWQKDVIGNETHYHHKITGHKARTEPDEQGGGILADEMGMGKTLSTIALIIAALGAANAWAHNHETHLSENIPAFKTLSHATLVVVPSPLLLSAWQKELRKHTEMALDVFVYHGSERNVDRAHLVKHDIVLTTYHTLVADNARNRELITHIAWYRIVLDEAHFIRRTSTSLHKRVAELDAKFRWCLTGTPIQNSLDDVGALFSFLNIAPFDRLGYFRRYISTQYVQGAHGLALAQHNLVKLLDAMCIRRTKDQINLQPVDETLRSIQLSPDERRQYNSMKEDMKRAMHNIISESDSRQRFGSFQAKLQLRLLCNHGTHQNHFHWAKNSNLLNGYREGFDNATADGNMACSICGSSDSMLLFEEDLMYTSNCVHTLCSTCRKKSFGQCPCCDSIARSRNVAPQSTTQESWTRRDLREDGHSSKMEALVQDLLACREDKSIVFSCWTTTLDLVARYLNQNHIPFRRIDGEQSFAHRQDVLDNFSASNSIAVLIMTTGVGAFGLDLIAANRVFLIEPQWNPSVESQAIGRTTRIGQHKTVQVTRYVARDTVEDELRDLQRRKRGIARMAEKENDNSMIKAE